MTSKLPSIGTSIFSKMSAMALKYKALNLSQGFPDFESDPTLIALVHEAMEEGYNQYAPMPGDAGLRREISEKMMKMHQKRYDWDSEVTITAGAQRLASGGLSFPLVLRRSRALFIGEKTADPEAHVGAWAGVSSGALCRRSRHGRGEGAWPATTFP